MKKSSTLIAFLFLLLSHSAFAQNQNVGIGTTNPDASSLLELKSTNKGVLVPRLTTAQRLAIVNPANSLLVYDTTLGCFYYYNGTTWVALCGNGGIVGPAGSTGATGDTGLQGVTGATGNTGSTGATGNNGTNGTNGAVGATGATGATGNNGMNGTNGAVGATGCSS